jgi:aspartate/tyrosine/aromatic aminotransferase
MTTRLALLNRQFAHVPMAPADPILSLTTGFKADKNPKKVNLGVGAYRDNDGKPFVFPVVRKVEAEIVANKSLDKEYLPIDGLADFTKGAKGVTFGWNSPLVTDPRVISLQTLSGTGALRVIGETLVKFRPGPIYVSAPTWGNHKQVFTAAGLQIRDYRYFDKKTKGLDIRGMIEDLQNATPGSTVLLHTCAHNPTGVDPTPAEWAQIADVCQRNNLYPFFDTAYQGFTSGDLDKDAYGLRLFIERGFEMVIAQSFAKIMGLYGERTGALHFVCSDKDAAARLLSQVKIIIRCNYSSPPKHGARIAAAILNDPSNRQQWLDELVTVTKRMNDMRNALRGALEAKKVKGDWSHITTQIGMFSFTGLTTKQSETMVNKHSIYMTKNGRISVCGVTSKNVDYIAESIKDVVDNY